MLERDREILEKTKNNIFAERFDNKIEHYVFIFCEGDLSLREIVLNYDIRLACDWYIAKQLMKIDLEAIE